MTITEFGQTSLASAALFAICEGGAGPEMSLGDVRLKHIQGVCADMVEALEEVRDSIDHEISRTLRPAWTRSRDGDAAVLDALTNAEQRSARLSEVIRALEYLVE